MTKVGRQETAPDTAVILAAGRGSRLYPTSRLPKPLVQVQGVTLAERVMETVHDATGIRRFIVTLGWRAGDVEAHFADVAGRLGVSVDFVRVADWDLGNGASALAASGLTRDRPFLLVMSDHLFDPAIARRLVDDPPGPGEMRLAIDRDKDGIFDLDDVTRVSTDGDRIAAIGKNLSAWDAADTGVMLCTSGLFEGLRRAAAKGQHGLSDGLRDLARERRAGVVDVTGLSWIDVDTPEARHEAERRLVGGYFAPPRVKETGLHVQTP